MECFHYLMQEVTEDINPLSSKETSINEELCKAVQEVSTDIGFLY